MKLKKVYKMPSTCCIAAMWMDQSFSEVSIDAILSNSLTSSFSAYILIESSGSSVVTSSAAQKEKGKGKCIRMMQSTTRVEVI